MRLSETLLFCFNCGLVVLFSEYYLLSFNYESDIFFHYYLLSGFLCLTAPFVILKFIQPITEIVIFDFVILLMITVFFVKIILGQILLSNEHAVVCCCFLMYILIVNHRSFFFILRKSVLIFISLYIFEILVGLYQILASKNQPLELIGTFGNSNIYVIFLVVIQPFIILELISLKSKFSTKIILLIGILNFFTLLFFMDLAKSRTGLISMLMFIALMIWFNRITILNLINNFGKIISTIFVTIVTIPFVWYCVGFLDIKALSSYGRLLKLKVVYGHLVENFFLGIGLGNGSYYYPLWQINYFNNAKTYNDVDFLAAGESYLIYNEPIQFFLELGFLAFFIFLLFLFSIYKTIQANSCYKFVTACKVSFLVIIASSFSYYSFHINILLLISSFCLLAIIQSDNANIIRKRFKVSIITSNLFFVSFGLILLIVAYMTTKDTLMIINFNERSKYVSGVLSVSYKDVERLRNGKLLATYAEKVYATCPDKAIISYKKSLGYNISLNSLNKLTKLYFEKKNYLNSIKYNRMAINLVPSLYAPRLAYIKSLSKLGLRDSAKIEGWKSLKLPVKIPTIEVLRIRAEIENFINQDSIPLSNISRLKTQTY